MLKFKRLKEKLNKSVCKKREKEINTGTYKDKMDVQQSVPGVWCGLPKW